MSFEEIANGKKTRNLSFFYFFSVKKLIFVNYSSPPHCFHYTSNIIVYSPINTLSISRFFFNRRKFQETITSFSYILIHLLSESKTKYFDYCLFEVIDIFIMTHSNIFYSFYFLYGISIFFYAIVCFHLSLYTVFDFFPLLIYDIIDVFLCFWEVPFDHFEYNYSRE